MVPEVQEFDQLDGRFIARALGQRACIRELALERQFDGVNGGARGLLGGDCDRWRENHSRGYKCQAHEN
jgi:hypothetical protein